MKSGCTFLVIAERGEHRSLRERARRVFGESRGGSIDRDIERVLLLAQPLSTSDYAFYVDKRDPASRSFVVRYGWCRRSNGTDVTTSDDVMEEVLDKHRKHGTVSAEGLSGQFVFISYDQRSTSLFLLSDAWGVLPFYYAATDRGVGFSDRAASLADLFECPVDGMAHLAWARGATIPPGRTLFRGVHRVNVGQGFRVAAKEGTCESVPVAASMAEPLRLKTGQVLDLMVERIGAVMVGAASRTGTMVDLSAGNDSRLTLAALTRSPEARREVTFRVVGEPSHLDVLGATRLAKLAGVRLRVSGANAGGVPTEDALLSSAAKGDTVQDVLTVWRRDHLDRTDWPDFQYHIGSLGGQLFRNWMWMYAVQTAGSKAKIDYGALLRHRLYNNPDIDWEGIAQGRVSREGHDEYLLEGARSVDAEFPDREQAYRLELIHMQGISQRAPFWVASDRASVLLPYLWKELTDISLRIPYHMKRTRRLVLDAVKRLNPRLCSVVTDQGAPFSRLTVKNSDEYLRYWLTYGLRVCRAHYLPRSSRLRPERMERVAPELRRVLMELMAGESARLVERTRAMLTRDEKVGTTAAEHAEMVATSHLFLVIRQHRGIGLEPDYTATPPSGLGSRGQL